MKLLAIDTSSLACSVALLADGESAARHVENEREHTAILFPMVRELLSDAGLALSQLDALVLGNGPGSFIGMRIAASAVQGMAYGSDLPVIPVSSLLAVAEQVSVSEEVDEVVVAQDAHMQQVYLGHFGRNEQGVLQALQPERLTSHEVIDFEDKKGVRVAAGFGWSRYPELWQLNSSQFDRRSDIHYPSAGYLLPAACAALEAGETIEPTAIEPTYLRHQVASPPVRS